MFEPSNVTELAVMLTAILAAIGAVFGAIWWLVKRAIGALDYFRRLERHQETVRRELEVNGAEHQLPPQERGTPLRNLVIQTRTEQERVRVELSKGAEHRIVLERGLAETAASTAETARLLAEHLTSIKTKPE